MNSFSIILGYSVTVGVPEIIIFLLAALLLGFSIHFYWTGKKTMTDMPRINTEPGGFSEDDQWRLEFYEQLEKQESAQERLEQELLRMRDAEKILLADLEEAKDEVSRLERMAERASLTESAPPQRSIPDLVMAQQHLQESLSREMTERLEKAYEEFNFLQDRIQKIQSMVIDPHQRIHEADDLEQSYFRITKEYDELKLRHLTLMEEFQQQSRVLTDTEEKLKDANFQRQQQSRKIQFLEELVSDLQQISGHHKKLEGQLKRISEIEALLARTTQEKR